MDFRTQRYFMTVAQELNFTRAAKKLRMSQPPLSSTIRDLEKELGVQLFIRGKRRLQLTEAGMLLYRRTEQILELAEKTKRELSDFEKELSGTLYVAAVDGRATDLLAGWIAGFREEYPRVSFDLTNGSSDEVIERLVHGLADLAVVAVPYDTERYDGISIGREPWAAIMPAEHPLAKRRGNTLPVELLKGESLALPQRPSRQASIREWLAGKGIEPDVFCPLSHYDEAAALAAHGAGIAIFPMTHVEPPEGVVVKILTKPAKYAEYVILQPKAAPLRGLPAEFVNFVRDELEAHEIRAKAQGGEKDPYAVPKGAQIL